MPTTFTLIGSTEIGSGGVSSVTFSSIPQTYNDLMLFSSARISASSRNDGLITVNATTNQYRYIFGEGYATNTLYSSYSNSYLGQDIFMNQNNHTANYFSTSQIYISNYKSTSEKPVIAYQGDRNNSAIEFYIQVGGGVINNGPAINTMLISPNSGMIQQYSTFHLYGISYT